jgi:PhnB protein
MFHCSLSHPFFRVARDVRQPRSDYNSIVPRLSLKVATKVEAAMAVKAIPEGHHSVTAYLVGVGAGKLVTFLEQAFGGTCVERINGPNGAIAHAEVKIGDTIIMLGEASERAQAYAATLHHYVTNVDEVHRRAVAAGAKVLSEPTDMFYGDRTGAVVDPCGNSWYIASHVEDVSPEEMERRMQAFRK